MEAILDKLIQSPEMGVFGMLFLLTFYLLRKDAISHRNEYKEILERMMEIVKQNTEANTKLHESIEHLRDKISQ
jgi:hypothetical protein